MSDAFVLLYLGLSLGWMGTGRFHTDPSGTFVRYDAKAIGSGSEAAQSELQDKWHTVRLTPCGIFATH